MRTAKVTPHERGGAKSQPYLPPHNVPDVKPVLGVKKTDKPGIGHSLHEQDEGVDKANAKDRSKLLTDQPGFRVDTSGDQERPQDILFRRRTSQFFFVINFFHIFFGVGTLILIEHYAASDHDKFEPYFYYLQMYHEIIALIICVAECTHILAGVIGLMWTNCCRFVPCPIKLFSSYENYLNVVLSLNIGASLVVAIIGARPMHKMLDDAMLTEAYHWSHHAKFNRTQWEKVHTITHLQLELRCCGLHDFRDWFLSPGRFIPQSCCDTSRLDDCKNALDVNDVFHTWSSRPVFVTTLARLREIRANVGPFLWSQNCMDALQAEVTRVRIRWAAIICVIILCQTFLFGWSSFLCRYVRIHVQYEKDVKRMIALREKLKLWDSFRDAHFGTSDTDINDANEGYLGILVPETPLEKGAENIYAELHQRRETLTKRRSKDPPKT